MKKTLLAALFVLIIASFFRFYNLDSTPPGLYPDEAMNGSNALEALQKNKFKIFYPENNGREGLFINIQAMFVRVFGAEPWTLRSVSGIFGVLTVMGIFFLSLELFRKKDKNSGPEELTREEIPGLFGLKRSERIALLSAIFAATSLWAVLFARVGFRANMAPCFLVWSLFLLVKSLPLIKKNFVHTLALMAAGGLIFGLGMHSYIAYRATPIIIAIIFFSLLGKSVKEKYSVKLISAFVVFTTASVISFAPLGMHFLKEPADFMGRTSQVSVFSSESPLKDLALNTIKTLGMWNIVGDFNWRHNYSGAPLLSPTIGIFFLVGIGFGITSLIKRRSGNAFPFIVLFSSIIVSLLPAVTSSEGIPHALRAIIAIPPVFIISGIGAEWIITKLANKLKPQTIKILGAALLVIIIIEGYALYFIRWANNPNVPGAYAENYVKIAREINSLPKEKPKYVLVKAGGADVRGWPMPAQSVMFITDTFLPENRPEKNVVYIRSLDEIPENAKDYSLFIID